MKHSNFVNFPIFLNGKQLNTVQAVWKMAKSDVSEEMYNGFFKFKSKSYVRRGVAARSSWLLRVLRAVLSLFQLCGGLVLPARIVTLLLWFPSAVALPQLRQADVHVPL